MLNLGYQGYIWQPGSLSGADAFNRVSKASKIFINKVVR